MIENITLVQTKNLHDDTLKKVIGLASMEMIKSQDNCPAIQKPCLEILVSIGRLHCDKVMGHLQTQLQTGQTSHFMLLHTMGTLSTANITGIMPFIKPVLITILPTMGSIKLDHVKQAYAFGKFSLLKCKVNF